MLENENFEIPKGKESRVFHLEIPTPDFNSFGEKDKVVTEYVTTEWIYLNGLVLLPPNTNIFMRLVPQPKIGMR